MTKKAPKSNEELTYDVMNAIANDNPGEAAGIVMQETANYSSKQSEAGMRAVQNILKHKAVLTQALSGSYEPPKRNRS